MDNADTPSASLGATHERQRKGDHPQVAQESVLKPGANGTSTDGPRDPLLEAAQAQFEVGRYAESAALYRRAAESSEKAAEPKPTAWGFWAAGRAYVLAAELKEAVAMYEKSVALINQPGVGFKSPQLALWVAVATAFDVRRNPVVQHFFDARDPERKPTVSLREHGSSTWVTLEEKGCTEVTFMHPESDVEVRVEYDNTSGRVENNVGAQVFFDRGVRYVGGSTYLKNASNPEGRGMRVDSDSLTTPAGINIGNYTPNSNAYLFLCAKVKDLSAEHHILARISTDHGILMSYGSFKVVGDAADLGRAPSQFPRAGWSGERAELNVEGDRYSKIPVFNAIHNNPNYGDERQFVIIKDAAHREAGGWHTELDIEPGRTYLVRVYVNNSACDRYSPPAVNTRVNFALPTSQGTSFKLWGHVLSDNSKPLRVGSCVVVTAGQPVVLRYVAGSARLFTNVFPRCGLPLSDDIMTRRGALVGYERLDGVVKPGYQYSSIATFKFQVLPAG